MHEIPRVVGHECTVFGLHGVEPVGVLQRCPNRFRDRRQDTGGRGVEVETLPWPDGLAGLTPCHHLRSDGGW